MKGFWFTTRGRQLLELMDPEASFYFPDGWFDGFKQRHMISFRRLTNVCQRLASDKESAVRSFHKNIATMHFKVNKQGRWENSGFIKWQMSTRHHYPSVLLMVLPRLTPETKLFGCGDVDLGWRRGNVLPRLPCLLTENPESSHC